MNETWMVLQKWAPPFVLGVIVTHLFARYRNRLTVLRWSANCVKVASAAEDIRLGKVTVLYNDQPVNNVHTASIQIENESNKDFDGVCITIASRDNTTINAGYGHLAHGDRYFLLTEDYMEELAQAKDEKLTQLLTYRRYLIPVLNRGATAVFQLVLSRGDMVTPQLVVGCVHKGVVVKNAPPGQTAWGVPLNHALFVGWTATLILLLTLITRTSSTWTVGLSAWALGLTVLPLGAIILKLFKRIRKLFN